MNKLKELRKIKGVSQSVVAEAIGVCQRTYGNYENGTRQADYYGLIKLSKYFNVSIDYLIGASELPYRDSELGLELEEEKEIIEKYRTIKALGGAETVKSLLNDLEKTFKK